MMTFMNEENSPISGSKALGWLPAPRSGQASYPQDPASLCSHWLWNILSRLTRLVVSQSAALVPNTRRGCDQAVQTVWFSNRRETAVDREQLIMSNHDGLLAGAWGLQSMLLPKNCPVRCGHLSEKLPVISRIFYTSAFLQQSQY